jgi:hypothetical protein
MNNRALKIVLLIFGTTAIAAILILAGFFIFGRFGCCGYTQGFFSPMMGGRRFFRFNSYAPSSLSIEDAEKAVENYIADYGTAGLHIGEIMIFDNHAYAEVVEEDTGIGAFELLIDPDSLSAYPEMGPNMMWNLKYGNMSGGMMGGGYGGSGVDMPISGEEAIRIASEYLRTNESDLTADDHPDPFYGYYTIHTIKDGEVYGMLSVNGYDGQVFLHTWHGEFIEMTVHEEEE